MSSSQTRGSVRFVMVDYQLKVFKNALQALSKIGSELLIEALPSQLVLRTINSSRSAYMSCTFMARYFDAYDVFHSDVVQGAMLLKQALAVFRSQRIRHFLFQFDAESSVLEMTILCENGLKKTFRCNTLTSEILQATVDKSVFSVTLIAETAAFARLLSAFHAGVDEIKLAAYPGSAGLSEGAVEIHSFLDPMKNGGDDVLMTQLSVNAQQAFLHYTNVTNQLAAVTFNLKDFRAMVSLCEQLGANILIRCEGPGMPVVLEPAQGASEEWGQDYAVELILATLVVEDDVDAQPPSQLAGEDTPQLQIVGMEGEPSRTEEHSGSGTGPHSQIASECDGLVMGTPPQEQKDTSGTAGVIARG